MTRAALLAERVGAASAAALGSAADAWYFLERGRAQGLAAILARRAKFADRPTAKPLADAERHVRGMQAGARARLRRARKRGDRGAVRAAARDLVAWGETLRRIAAAAQGLAIAGAHRVEVTPPAVLQKSLGPREALVSYGFLPPSMIAVVLTSNASRVVDLGAARPVATRCSELQAALVDSSARPAPAIEALRAALVRPLGLEARIQRVLVSAHGPLRSVPISLLFRDRTVESIPSATVLQHASPRRHGAAQRILALGDPDYSTVPDTDVDAVYRRRAGGRLVRLPATRLEVQAVGTEVLLGSEASEARLRAALTDSEPWRAIHLACHGILDEGRPLFSSLALSAGVADDGFVSVLDVMRMRVDCDLVVLSACETARGSEMTGEGLLGLPRAFLIAGARRVLCSLWRVDDEATRALMVKFYELWSPKDGAGIGAAEALKRAQAHVRSRPAWKHPFYWAAWVLWGLPD